MNASIVTKTYRLHSAHLTWARLMSGQMVEYLDQARLDHEGVMQAIRANDLELARTALHKHHSNLEPEIPA